MHEYFGKNIKIFQSKRVSEECPFLYRVWMLKEITRLREEEIMALDYLQIFKFSLVEKDGKILQEIIHSQEVPEYSRIYYFEPVENGISAKFYIIDDGADYATIIFADEY